MVQRFALLVGGLGAAGVLAFALGLGNFVLIGSTDAVSANQAPADLNTLDAVQPAAPDQVAVTTDQQPQVVVKKVRDTVYIEPSGKAPVVRVNKPAANKQPKTNRHPAADTAPKQPSQPTYTERDDGGHESDSGERESEHSRGQTGEHEGSSRGGGDD